MKSDFARIFYAIIIRRLPRHRRTTGDYYFFTFCFFAIFFLVLAAPFLYAADLWRPAWSAIACATFIGVLLALWQGRLFSLTVLQALFQAALFWIIVYNAYFTGGITSPLMVWMGIVPILPLFTTTRRLSYVFLAIAFFGVIAVYSLQLIGLIPIKEGDNLQSLTLSVMMNGLLCTTLVNLVMTYDSVQTRHLRTIEKKNTALKKLSNDLQLADKHKDRFLATVSHEMRTPLNAMMGYLGLLRSAEGLTSIAASYVDGAKNSASHLLTVINDLLDFSQIQKGKLVLSLQDVDLHQVLRDTHNTLKPKAINASINYPLLIDDSVPRWVNIDPHRLSQIFLNLLGNALKFTRQGEVSTHVLFEPASEKHLQDFLVLRVQDTGIGIPRSFFTRIFEPFSQLPVQHPTDSSLRGNGLGLSITKTLVTHMGGSISLDSQVDVGSVFEVQLPIGIVSEPLHNEPTPAMAVNLEPIYLLLVDDHATNRLVTSATIKQDLPKAIIDQARNGSEAVEKMKTNRYDLVLMDMIMPDFSGIEVTRIIRTECPPPLSDVTVVALTASVAETLAQDCEAVGISEILRKPFDRNSLIRAILRNTKANPAPNHKKSS